MDKATDILRDAKKLLKGAESMQEKAYGALDDAIKGADKETKKVLAPLLELKRDLGKAQGTLDVGKITEILDKLQEINVAGVTNTK